MTDRPILFSAPMIRALLAGTKTQTRRILKPQPELFKLEDGRDCLVTLMHLEGDRLPRITLGSENAGVITRQEVRFAAGDRLWVRETHAIFVGGTNLGEDDAVLCRADGHKDEEVGPWRPSIFMPRWASRLTLIVTDVRVQRLQDISKEDAMAEGITRAWVIVGANCNGGRHSEVHDHRYFFDGCPDEGFEDAVSAYAALWGAINGPDAWDADPWIVALTFDVRKGNIDG